MTARTGAAAFAAEMERLDLDAEMRAALDHWHAEIAEGRVSVGEARKVPAQAVAARDRLLAHLREVEKDDGVGAGHVYERYSRVFKSRNIPGVTEVIVEMKRFGLVQGMSIVPDVDRVERFLERFPPEEVLRRFDKLQAWMVKYHKTNPRREHPDPGPARLPVRQRRLRLEAGGAGPAQGRDPPGPLPDVGRPATRP